MLILPSLLPIDTYLFFAAERAVKKVFKLGVEIV